MADTIDQQFIEFVAKTIVSNPEKVEVKRTIDEKGVLLELYVDPEDLGRVIGRGGSTAKSMRTLLRALGVKNDARYNLKIVDTAEDAPAPRREESEPETTEETPAPAESETTSSEDLTSEATSTSEEVATPDKEPAAEPEEKSEEFDALGRHRQDISDLTDLDI